MALTTRDTIRDTLRERMGEPLPPRGAQKTRALTPKIARSLLGAFDALTAGDTTFFETKRAADDARRDLAALGIVVDHTRVSDEQPTFDLGGALAAYLDAWASAN